MENSECLGRQAQSKIERDTSRYYTRNNIIKVMHFICLSTFVNMHLAMILNTRDVDFLTPD